MNKLISAISNLSDQRQRIFAVTLLTMGAVDCLLGMTAYFIGQAVLGGVLVALAFGFIFIFLPMLLKGYPTASRVMVPYYAAVFLFIGACYYGPSINVQLTIFIGAIYRL